MSNIFAGLEDLGFKNVEKVDVYQESDSEKKKQEAAKQDAKKETNEEDLLFDKSYTCPVCDHEFKSRMVRTGKVRLVGADSDLRPRYMGVDSLKYDVRRKTSKKKFLRTSIISQKQERFTRMTMR